MSMSTQYGMGATGRSAGNAMTGNKSAGSKPPGVQWGKSSGGYKSGQMQNFTPEQMQLFQQMFGHLGPDSFLGRLASGDESGFDEMEAPAWRDFQAAQGQLASRFSGMGDGARKGSGFQNSANQASSDFASQLQSNRMNIRNQSIKDLLGMSNHLLNQRPHDNFLLEKQPSFWEKIFGAIGGAGLSGASGGLSGYLGNLGNSRNKFMNNPTG
jgi:hypothetical protein